MCNKNKCSWMHLLKMLSRCINAVECIKTRHAPRCIHKMQAILSVHVNDKLHYNKNLVSLHNRTGMVLNSEPMPFCQTNLLSLFIYILYHFLFSSFRGLDVRSFGLQIHRVTGTLTALSDSPTHHNHRIQVQGNQFVNIKIPVMLH